MLTWSFPEILLWIFSNPSIRWIFLAMLPIFLNKCRIYMWVNAHPFQLKVKQYRNKLTGKQYSLKIPLEAFFDIFLHVPPSKCFLKKAAMKTCAFLILPSWKENIFSEKFLESMAIFFFIYLSLIIKLVFIGSWLH